MTDEKVLHGRFTLESRYIPKLPAMKSTSSIQSDINRYREALRLAYGQDYDSKIRVEHVHRDVVAITFPKGGRALVRRDRLQILTQYLRTKADQPTNH